MLNGEPKADACGVAGDGVVGGVSMLGAAPLLTKPWRGVCGLTAVIATAGATVGVICAPY